VRVGVERAKACVTAPGLFELYALAHQVNNVYAALDFFDNVHALAF
jgi:hypothetical protein